MPTREEMNSLAQEIISSYEARVEGVAQMRKASQEQLRELDQAHNAMAQQLRADLSQAENARRQDEAQRAQGRGQVRAQQSADAAEAKRQREQEIAQRKSDVASQLRELHQVRAGARAAWQEMAATMAAKRGVAVAVAEAPPAPPAVEEVAPTTPVEDAAEEEEEEEAGEVGEVTQELVSLSQQVFEYLANHPDGTRLTELEHEFGLGRFQAARVVRHLMDEGKAEKRDLLYFAI